nr:hypothetical protein Iba_chr06eCG1110 [Ipomoea batatas]
MPYLQPSILTAGVHAGPLIRPSADSVGPGCYAVVGCGARLRFLHVFGTGSVDLESGFVWTVDARGCRFVSLGMSSRKRWGPT